MFTIGVAAERADEPRIAVSPETVKKLTALGAEVRVPKGAGLQSRFSDSDYEAAGAKIAPSSAAAVKDADIVVSVRRPLPDGLKKGALVIGMLDPYAGSSGLQPLAAKGASLFSMELMPRITRAQSMDVLSSQSNLAGYKAVVDAASLFQRALPMMMTAAGTVPAARVFVMGAGVAGLQAVATARRLGAIVSATDVRPAAKEQVASLGAKFIAVEDEEFKQAETSAGYAKEMSAEYRQKQAALVAEHVKTQDIVVTTALIPGRPAPTLITKEMVESMKPGSIVVDLAVERGGNCALAKPGETVEHKGVRIVGSLNAPGQLSVNASSLYARNLYAFIETLVDKETKTLKVDWDDDIVRGTALARDGQFVHPMMEGGTAPAAAKSEAAVASPSALPPPPKAKARPAQMKNPAPSSATAPPRPDPAAPAATPAAKPRAPKLPEPAPGKKPAAAKPANAEPLPAPKPARPALKPRAPKGDQS